MKDDIKDLIKIFAPYIVLGAIIYIYRNKIKELLPFKIDTQEYKEAKTKLANEIKKEGLLKTGANILKGFAYTIYEPQYKDAQYFKNQQWIMDLKKGWKTKEQVLKEIKATGYKVLPELDKLLRSK
jgi:hypothetical protein